jgi:hypothetical protein
LSILVDSVFLVGWVAVQYLADNLIARLRGEGLAHWVLVLLQAIFAVSTLVPVAVYIVADLYLVVQRGRARIRQAREL